jgi:hypothetical protein
MANFYNEENGIYYIDDVATTLNSDGTGSWNDYFYYINGELTTLDGGGTGFWNGKAYVGGYEQPTGWNESFYYINNVQTTLDSSGNGTWNGQTYVNGVVQNGGGGGGGGGSVNLESGLQAFYKLSDTSDSSGNNRTLTNNGGVTFAPGKIGNAAVFDGSGGLQSVPLPSGGNEFSVNLWVKPITRNHPDGDGIISINQFSDGLLLRYGGQYNDPFHLFGTYSSIDTETELPQNVWSNVVITANGSLGKLYINGLLKETISYSGTLSEDSNLTLGYSSHQTSETLNGQIDAVGIWNRALSDAEVAELYNNGTGLELEVQAPVVDLEDGLQAFYKLSDTSDSSGNNRTLTNNGGVTFAPGKIGNAAVFDGNNWFTSDTPFVGSSDWTISVWVNADTLFSGGQMITLNSAFDVYITTGVGIVINNAQEDNQSSVRPINQGQWYHYVVRYSSGVTTTFLNNVIDTPSLQQTFGSGNNIGIGSFDGDMFYQGKLDAIGIWNRALSDAEVAELYNNGTGLELGTTPTLNTLAKIQGNAKFYGKVKFAG